MTCWWFEEDSGGDRPPTHHSSYLEAAADREGMLCALVAAGDEEIDDLPWWPIESGVCVPLAAVCARCGDEAEDEEWFGPNVHFASEEERSAWLAERGWGDADGDLLCSECIGAYPGADCAGCGHPWVNHEDGIGCDHTEFGRDCWCEEFTTPEPPSEVVSLPLFGSG